MIRDTTKAKLKYLDILWKKHRQGARLAAAGRRREPGARYPDNLLHALIPLFITRADSTVEVTSGDASRLWAARGVKVSPQVIAKMLREHIGYSRRTKFGPQITPNGVKYVEAALAQ